MIFKLLFYLILVLVATSVVSAIVIGIHKFFFKQKITDIIEEASEDKVISEVKKKAEKIRKK